MEHLVFSHFQVSLVPRGRPPQDLPTTRCPLSAFCFIAFKYVLYFILLASRCLHNEEICEDLLCDFCSFLLFGFACLTAWVCFSISFFFCVLSALCFGELLFLRLSNGLFIIILRLCRSRLPGNYLVM